MDPESDSGKQYVADWSFEPGKVVLHHDWVTKSIAEGRALLGQDDWGGMRLLATSNGHDAIMQSVSPTLLSCSISPVQEVPCQPHLQTTADTPSLQRTQAMPNCRWENLSQARCHHQ